MAAELVGGFGTLEYRGYDSAGIAVLGPPGLSCVKTAGEPRDLRSRLEAAGYPEGSVGVGHTRWSIHGPPTDADAHPDTDCSGRIAVVHNGIIENHAALRQQLRTLGHEFISDTDSEVVAHLIIVDRVGGRLHGRPVGGDLRVGDGEPALSYRQERAAKAWE